MDLTYLKRRLAEIAADNPIPAGDDPASLRAWDRNPIRRHRMSVLVGPQPNAAPRCFQRIYIFAAREYVKVGISNDPERRWKVMRIGNPLLEPAIYVSQASGVAWRFENMIHKALAKYRVVNDRRSTGREWFKCNRYFAIEVAKQITGDE